MPDWLFYAFIVLWVVWTINEARLSWWISKRVSRYRTTWGNVCLHLYWLHTIFFWSYILIGLGAISIVSSLFE